MLQCKKILKKFFFAHEKLKKTLKKVAHNFITQSSPGQQPTVQNWFSILWNLGTRDLFSYLWTDCTRGSKFLTHTLYLYLFDFTTLISVATVEIWQIALLNQSEKRKISIFLKRNSLFGFFQYGECAASLFVF